MRLGLLGPANGDLAGLARVAEFLLNGVKVSRAIYLGDDHALEETVGLWAESLVGSDPSDEGVWQRALCVAVGGTPEQIDAFLRAERARLRLKSLEAMPGEGRTVEMFGDRVAILIFDKALLDEEDIYSAQFLVYGKSEVPLVKKIGTRWFLTPGPIGSAGGGAIVLEETPADVVATVYDSQGQRTLVESLTVPRTAKLRVLGEP
jgi:hypothetical protein